MAFAFARSLRNSSSRGKFLAGLAVVTLLTLAMPALASAKGAAEPGVAAAAVAACEPSDVSSAVNAITVTPSVVSINDPVEVNFSGSLPDGGCAGDFIKIPIPDELAGLSGTFPIKTPDGTVIATMVVTARLVTITFNDYVETHDHVVFRGFLKAKATSVAKPDTKYDLSWPVGDKTITTPITTGPCKACEAADVDASKFAVYEDGTPPFIRFGISTAATRTADESITISDAVDSGQAIDCDSIRMSVGDSLTAWGTVDWDGRWAGFKVQSCSDSAVTVTLKATKIGQFFRLEGRSLATAVQSSYTDKGTVEQHGLVKGVRATARTSEGGGSGEGVNRQPEIDIEKWSTNQGPESGDYDHDAKELDPATAEAITFTITNTGNERLRNIVVGDVTTAGTGDIEDLTCDFSALGGPSSGTTWDGPFAVGETFECTGSLPALGYDATHSDTATVTATGQGSGSDVTDSDDWNAETPSKPASPQPEVDIEKWSTVDGPMAGDFDDAAKWVQAGAEPRITFTITNTGDEDLIDLVVSDKTIAGSAEVRDLTCDFSALGGPSTGTTWAGPFKVGATFECQGTLSPLAAGATHEDRASIVATGAESGHTVTDTDDWNAEAQPDLPSTGQSDVPSTGQSGGQPALPATGSSAVLLPLGLIGMLMIAAGAFVMRKRA